jgi:hypothetical protein
LRYFVALLDLQLLLVNLVSCDFDEGVPFADVEVLALLFLIRMQLFRKQVLGFLPRKFVHFNSFGRGDEILLLAEPL